MDMSAYNSYEQQLAASQKREAAALAACKLKDGALQSVLSTRNEESRAAMASANAEENFTDPHIEQEAYSKAMIAASAAEKSAKEALAITSCTERTEMSEISKCELCGEPMPRGEEMFKFHGYSGPCPKASLPSPPTEIEALYQQLTSMEDKYLVEKGMRRLNSGESESLRQQLAAALAACKLKDESLEAAHNGLRWWMDAFPLHVTEADNEEMLKIVKALAIQPDDAALKAWLGEPHSYLYKFNSEFGDGTFWSHRPTHNGADALETIPLYKPKELK